MSAFLRRADLIKFVKTWLAIMCVNVLQESLKRKTATYARVSTSSNYFNSLVGGGGGGSGSLFYGLCRYVRPQRVCFLAVLVRNRVWFLHSSLEFFFFFFSKKVLFHHYR